MIRAITFIEMPGSGYFEVNIHDYTKEEQPAPEPVGFFSYVDARKYLSQQRRKWLIEHYTNFVKHKSKLFRVSGSDHYRDMTRLDNLTRLENSLGLISNMTAAELCNVIINAMPLLRSILPHHSNSSSLSAQANLDQIIAVALDEINNVHGLFKPKIKSPIYY